MSYEQAKNSVQQWHPNRWEINEILEKLELSPIHSDTEVDDAISKGRGRSTENNGGAGESSESMTTIHDELDHEELYKTLLKTEKEVMINEMKNDWLHQNLVKHFMKKQMGHVCCTDEIGDKHTMNEYMNKLYDLYEMEKKLKVDNERWDAELSQLRLEIRARKEEEKVAFENIFSTGTFIGTSVWNHGKSFPAKFAQELISKQLEKIEQISQNRFHLTQLSSELNSIQDSLNNLIAINANLTKNDYEGLEAEKFYYDMELRNKVSECEQLVAKNHAMKKGINLIRKKTLELKTQILECEKISHDLRKESQQLLQTKRSLQNELAIVKKSIDTSEFSCRDREIKIMSRLAEIRCEHKEWMEKIKNILRVIKHRSRTKNASSMDELTFKKKKIDFSY